MPAMGRPSRTPRRPTARPPPSPMADVIFALAVAAMLALAFSRPGTTCGLVLVGFVMEQCAQVFVPLAGRNEELFNYVIAAAVGIAATRQLLRFGPALFVRGPATGALFLLLCYLAASQAWSLFPSRTESSLLKMLPYLGVFAVVSPLTVRTAGDLRDAFLFLIYGTVATLLVLLVFAHWEARSIYLPFSNGHSNPLTITQVAGSALICAALTPLVRESTGRWFLPVASGIALVVLITFLRTQSRGQIAAAVGVTALFSAGVRRGRSWLILAGLGLALTLSSGFLEDEVSANAVRWDRRQLGKDIESGRLDVAERLLDYWLASSPVHQTFGLGHATAADPRLVGAYPHLVPLEVLCEEGIVGFTLYLGVLATALRGYWKAFVVNVGPVKALLPALLGLFCFEFMLTLKQGTLTGDFTFLLFVCLSDSVRRPLADEAAAPETQPLAWQT